VAPYGTSGASTRARALDWAQHLGVDIEPHFYLGSGNTRPVTLLRDPLGVVRAEIGLRRLRRRPPRRLLLVRNASPFSNGRLERGLLATAGRGVYDFDDALMVPQPGSVAHVFSRARAWAAAVRAADHVIAGNEWLAAAAVELNPRVTVIPTCVDPDAYRVKTSYAIGDHPLAVWVGSPSTEKYLVGAAPGLLAEHRRSGLRLRLVSAGDQPLGVLAVMTERLDWRPGLVEQTLAEADVGVMPMADGLWERGKCAYKLLQYGASALPVVGSPVGVNVPVLDAMYGMTPVTPSDWGDALRAVIDEGEDARRARGERARAVVCERFSFAAWGETWRSVVLDGQDSAGTSAK
jgi:glycosyltransferase involved in cell wall biosynthesis